MDEVKKAMKEGQKARLSTLRLMTASIKQVEVYTREQLDDAAVLSLLVKMQKQRHDSIAQFQLAGRSDLVEQEQNELAVIAEFLPTPLSLEEIQDLVEQAVRETHAVAGSDMAKVMAWLKDKVEGRAMMKDVGELVKKYLSKS